MTMPRPFRFLADVPAIVDGRDLAEKAKQAEMVGIDVLVVTDHLIDQLAPIPAMATIAAATERLRIGTFVFNNDLRHPAVLAQDLASLDVLSGGRLEIGIGAGWNKPEYDAIGLPYDPVGTRVSRLEESIAVLKGLFGDGPLTYRGRHYTITAHDGRPKPTQKPHPPFMVGGGGRRTLSIAGREAQIVSFAPRLVPGTTRGDPHSITMAATEEKVGWVREAAGDRFADLELNIYPSLSPVLVTDHARAEVANLAARLRGRTPVDVTEDELLESPNIFIGSVDGLVDKLIALRARLGISSVMVGELGELTPVVERLAGS